ncbi:MAG: hypothetical protein K2K85_03670 [Clostridia bacterium]|nr:hypothetical protein [Clostridia bacterium]
MDKLTKQIIKCKVMQYPHLQNKIADDISSVSEKITSVGVSGGKCSVRNISSFDERLVSIMCKEDYLWREAIELAADYFKERGREEVVKAVEGLYWKRTLNADGVALKLNTCRAQVYRKVDDFFEMVHKYAIRNGVMSVN